MTIADTYSNYLDVSPTEIDFPSTFTIIPSGKYIVINTGSSSPGRVYDYYNKVIELIQFELGINDVTVVQIGEPGDYQITSSNRYVDKRGGVSLRQQVFLIENAALYVGNDAVYSQIAKLKNIKSVILYGVCPPTEKCISEASFEYGSDDKYSYDENERDKRINKILPEDVSKSVSFALGLNYEQKIKTLQINSQYLTPQIDYIPDFPIQPGVNSRFLCRFDLSQNFQALVHFYSLYEAPLYTSSPLEEGFLAQFKSRIKHIYYSLDGDYSLSFVKILHKSGIGYSLLTDKTGESLRNLKFELFDYNSVLEKDISARRQNASKFIEGDISFETSRLYLSRGKMYPSRYHWQEGIDTETWIKDGKQLGPVNSKNFLESWENFYIFENILDKK